MVAPAENIDHLRLKGPPAANAAALSRRRSLLRDLAAALGFQMRYWGMDAKGGKAAVIVQAGLTRIPRAVRFGEGSSRYRETWRGGCIELHSFCAGFYHPDKAGILFSRADARVSCATPGSAPDPVFHRRHRDMSDPDSVLAAVPPFLEWLLDYEDRVEKLRGPAYRQRCWTRLGGRKFGPPPDEQRRWLASLLESPHHTPRLHRGRKSSPAKNSTPAFPQNRLAK